MYEKRCVNHVLAPSWVQNFGDEGLALLLSMLKRLQEEKDEYQ